MDEMTEKIGQALQELRNRNVDSSYGFENPPTALAHEEQLPPEINDFIQRRREERARQKNISAGVYG